MLAERKKSIFNISYLVLYKKHLRYTCIGHIGKRKINSFTSKYSNRSILATKYNNKYRQIWSIYSLYNIGFGKIQNIV